MKTKIITLFMLLLVVLACRKDKIYVAPSLGLISYFNFDDNLKDEQGYSNDAVAPNNLTFVAGRAGKGIALNGLDQYVDLVPKIAKTNDKISVSFWFKSNDSNSRVIMYNSSFMFTTYQNGGDLRFILASSNEIAYSGPYPLNQWVHVVGTYDGVGETKIYLNGIMTIDENSINPFITGFDSKIKIGVYNTQYWAGTLDELYIYDRVLSAAEVNELYHL